MPRPTSIANAVIVVWNRQEHVEDKGYEVFGPFVDSDDALAWIDKFQSSLGGAFHITIVSDPLVETS